MKSLTYALVAILTVCMIGASMTSHIYAENSDKVRENGQMQDDEKINDWKVMKKYNCDKMYKHGEKDKYGAFMIDPNPYTDLVGCFHVRKHSNI